MSIDVARLSWVAMHAVRMAAALGLVAVAAIQASAEPISFVAPAAWAGPSTVDIASPAASGVAQAPASALAPGDALINPATLANFAQTEAQEAEEIEATPEVNPAWIFRPITQVTIDTAFPPEPCRATRERGPKDFIESPRPRFDDARFWGGWAETNYQWVCTALCHRPLYFEQVNVERYGYTVSPLLQPAISGAHFFLTIPTLPYKLVAQPPRECVYTLGYYRAGSRVPRRWHHVNWDPTAATVEGLVVTGLVFLIP